jgi:hypothetical protein
MDDDETPLEIFAAVVGVIYLISLLILALTDHYNG